MKTAYIDTETLGLYGPAAIIQVQFNYDTLNHDSTPFIFDPWNNPSGLTRALIEEIVGCRVVAHNLTFDWQKLSQFYNALASFKDHERPIDHVQRFAHAIYSNRSLYCLKPRFAVCTMLLAQKNLGGSALSTREIRVRRLPKAVAEIVALTLNKNTHLPDALFAKRTSPVRWSTAVSDAGPAWSDVVLRFGPSNGLKELAKHVLGVDDTTKIGEDVHPPEFPFELGYAPYAHLLNSYGEWEYHEPSGDGQFQIRKLWPLLIHEHVYFWTHNAAAAKYALQDIDLLRRLASHLGDPVSDFDSELACQVASVRVAGMGFDEDALVRAALTSQAVVKGARLNVDSVVQVRKFVTEALDPMEALVVASSCDKDHLKTLITSMITDEREDCCRDGCPRCDGKGYLEPGEMPVVERARHILEIRKHRKRVQLYGKLVIAQSVFPSFRVIGTKSGRMSGADGLNYHGIDKSKDIREIFTLTEHPDWVVCGGDFSSQELAITAAVMNDEALGDVLRDDKKLHAIFAAEANGVPYEQIMEFSEDKTRPESKWYAEGKVTTYSILFGASGFKLSMDLGCSPEEGDRMIAAFFNKFPGMAEARKKVKLSLDCLRSEEGGKLSVVIPERDYVETVFGYRRSFGTELQVMNTMLDAMDALSSTRLPAEFEAAFTGDVLRTEKKGVQTIPGAVKSALYGAIFSLQGKVFRAATNHLIQSTGRTCTLRVQKRIWDELQPVGIHPFNVKLMSIHDEVITTCHRDDALRVQQAVAASVAETCETIPLLSLDWATDVKSWYGVKTTPGVRCGYGAKS